MSTYHDYLCSGSAWNGSVTKRHQPTLQPPTALIGQCHFMPTHNRRNHAIIAVNCVLSTLAMELFKLTVLVLYRTSCCVYCITQLCFATKCDSKKQNKDKT